MLLWCGACLVVLFVVARLVRVPAVSTRQAESTGNTGEIIGSMEVGQTFESIRPSLVGVAFQFATFSNRTNTADVIFELRRAPGDAAILRTVRVNASALRDHQRTVFRFAPIADARGKTFYASVRSPSSTQGNAVALDVSARNAYAKLSPSSLVLFRGPRSAPDAVARATKAQADLVFDVLHSVPLTERIRAGLGDAWQALREEPSRWWLDGRLAALALVLALLALGLPRWLTTNARPWRASALLLVLVLAGFALRALYAHRLPLTNDEGTILYDALTVLQGRLPGGDGVLKMPTVLGAMAAGIAALGPQLLTARTVSIAAGLLTVLPLLGLARAASGLTSPVPTAALWLLAAFPAIFSVYGHPQPVELLLGVGGLALLALALRARAETSAPRDRWDLLLALAAGALLGLAFGARKTAAALAVPALLLLLLTYVPWQRRVRTALAMLVGGVLVVGALLTLEVRLYGPPGAQHLLGLQVARLDPDSTATPEQRQSALIKGILPAGRESLPLAALALVGLGASLEALASPRAAGLRRLVWIIPIGAAWFSRSFVLSFERSENLAYGIVPFWTVTVGVLVALALLPRAREDEAPSGTRRNAALHFLLPVLWMAAVAMLYASWIKFTANYLAEFIPPLLLLAAGGAAWLGRAVRPRQVVVPIAVALVAWGAYSAARSGLTFPHTGTFDLASLREAAAVMRTEIPQTDLVLTGALALPVTTGHRVPFDVAHPTHYAYGFIEPTVRNVYMAPAEQMVQTVLRDIRWVVEERLTAFSYYREYPEIEQHVRENFTLIREIENLSNPIRILKRREP